MRETALEEARRAEDEIKRGRYRGPLHGIPYGVKDLCATREAPTTWGATPYKEQRFDYDATVVTRLRPTYGAVSRHGAMALSWTLDKLGPMCRSALDCGLVLSAIAGRDPLDPTSRASERLPRYTKEGRPANATRRAKRLRVGVMKNSYEKAQEEVRRNFLASLDVLRRFADVRMDAELPQFPYGPAVGTIVDAEGASAFRELIESGRVAELASPEGRVGGYAAPVVTAVDYLHAMRMRAPMRRAWAEMFKKVDVLAAPSRATVSYPVDKTFDKAYPGIGGASPTRPGNRRGR